MQKPQIREEEARGILLINHVTDKVALIGIRGYYLDSIGKPGENDRNRYDDVIIIVSPRKFEVFRANTDPSIYRKGIATLKTGVHRYYKGKHKNRYWALRLVGEQAPVERDGQDTDSIGIALNIHKGGFRTTGSEGCQTLSPNDWDDFIEIVYEEMTFFGQKTIPYVLIDEKERRRGAIKMPHLSAKITDADIEDLLNNISQEKVEPKPTVNSQNPADFPAIPSNVPQDAAQPPLANGNEILTGAQPTDGAHQVSQAKVSSRIYAALGVLSGMLAAAKGFLSDNTALVIVGILCLTMLLLALIFRGVILDYLRMQLFSDPKRFNVK